VLTITDPASRRRRAFPVDPRAARGAWCVASSIACGRFLLASPAPAQTPVLASVQPRPSPVLPTMAFDGAVASAPAIVGVEIDPDHVFPDIDRANQVWTP
jgi:hypothetical protein